MLKFKFVGVYGLTPPPSSDHSYKHEAKHKVWNRNMHTFAVRAVSVWSIVTNRIVKNLVNRPPPPPYGLDESLSIVLRSSDWHVVTLSNGHIEHDILKTSKPILIQIGTNSPHGQGHETGQLWGQEVKGQGHTRPKIDVEACRRSHSRPVANANWLFSSYTEDVFFWSVLGTLSALEALFATMRYINWHLHLQLSWIHVVGLA